MQGGCPINMFDRRSPTTGQVFQTCPRLGFPWGVHPLYCTGWGWTRAIMRPRRCRGRSFDAYALNRVGRCPTGVYPRFYPVSFPPSHKVVLRSTGMVPCLHVPPYGTRVDDARFSYADHMFVAGGDRFAPPRSVPLALSPPLSLYSPPLPPVWGWDEPGHPIYSKGRANMMHHNSS